MSALAPVELLSATYEWVIFAITMTVGGILLKKYLKTRNPDLLILAICIMVLACAPIFQSFDIFFFDRIPSISEASYGYRMAYLLSGYGNILLALFFLRLYKVERVNLIVSIYAIMNIINTSLIVYIGYLVTIDPMYPIYQIIDKTILRYSTQQVSFPIESFQTLFMVIHLILAMSLYIYMIQAAYKSSKKDVSLKVKRGFQLIASFGLFLMLTFIFFILDFISQILFGSWYSFWTFLGWTCAAIGAIMAYLGYAMPDWLKKRWET